MEIHRQERRFRQKSAGLGWYVACSGHERGRSGGAATAMNEGVESESVTGA